MDFGVSVYSMDLDHLINKMGFLTTNDAKLEVKSIGNTKPVVTKFQFLAKKAPIDATKLEEYVIEKDENDVESTDDDGIEEAKEEATRVIRSNMVQIL
jgi:hypothetical protein